jgi:hypothetical protein
MTARADAGMSTIPEQYRSLDGHILATTTGEG